MNNRISVNQFRNEFNYFIEGYRARGCSSEALVLNIETWLNVMWSRLPDFPSDMKIKRDFKPTWYTGNPSRCILFKGKYYAKPIKVELTTFCMDPSQAIGSTWLYSNDRTEGRPFPDRLARLLLGRPENIPAIFADKAGNYFRCEDGNHRIYAAYLLGRKVNIQYYEEYSEIYDSNGLLIS